MKKIKMIESVKCNLCLPDPAARHRVPSFRMMAADCHVAHVLAVAVAAQQLVRLSEAKLQRGM